MQLEKKYDVVIIGSGLAGLVCGTILSKEGMRVCILEKNEQLGGSLQTFKRDGVTFDTGVHYIGGLDKGQNLYQLFNYLGILDRLELHKMDEQGFDAILFKNDPEEYLMGMGYDNFTRILSQKFPEEADAITSYCKRMKEICDNFPLYNLKPGSREYSDQTVFTTSVKQYLETLTSNVKLQNVLAGNTILYAGVPDVTPLYIHALILNSYIESSWKCAKGGDQISKLLARVIKENGGTILRKAEVKKMNVENNKATFVELINGERYYADTFISNIPPNRTLELTDTSLIRPAYRNRINGLENSVSIFVVYIKMKPERVLYKNRNYYYHTDDNAWKAIDYTEESWPSGYAMFECVPPKQSKFTEAMAVMSYMRFEDVKQWANTDNTTLHETERGADYEEFKRVKAEKIIDAMEIKFPGIRNNIETYYTSTPLSYRDYIGSTDGNLYGVLKDCNDPIKSMISPKTKIPNLLLTGQNTNLHGVLGVTISGVVTCSMLLGNEYLLNKIAVANQ